MASSRRIGQWLPKDQSSTNRWLQQLHEEAKSCGRALHPVLEEFKDLIEHDPELFMLFNQMFAEIPKKPPYNKDPEGKPEVRSYQQMLKMMNLLLTKAPEFNKSKMVGLPLNAILDWSMGTRCGIAAFLNKKVNHQLKKILDEWALFLGSGDSCYVLTEDPEKGWLGRDAMEAMPNFVKEFKCDPSKPHWGFTSWDHFFTREFREGARPVAFPEDDHIIVNVCESAPYNLARRVKPRDRFWVKGQPYSVEHMLASDPYWEGFVGGTVYQAFLSSTSYHRWHSPVNGKILKAYVKAGTYYAEAPSVGLDPDGEDASQGFTTEIATRALIFIQASDPLIGLVCVLLVGLGEVSSCDIRVYTGQEVRKGEELGMFHFGGSTYCLLFGPHLKLEFDLRGQEPGMETNNIPVNSKLATIITLS